MKNFKLFLSKHKYILMSVIILILAAGIIAVGFYYFGGNDIEPENDFSEPDSKYYAVNNTTDGVLSGDSCILLVCNSKNIGEAMFMCLLDFHIFAEEIVVTPLNMDTSDGKHSYYDSYSYGGIDNLIDVVEKVRSCEIDRYAIIDEDGVCKLTDVMGKVNLYVSEDYTYESSDKSYSVSTGYNDLEASMLYTYLEINSNKENSEEIIAEIICTIINSYMSVIDKSQSQELFSELCNCVTTDITISDYYSASADIEYIIQNRAECIVYK